MAQATLTNLQPAADPITAQPLAGRRVRLAAALAALVLVAAWFLPAIVGRSGLRHRFVHAVVPAYPGGATVGSASLGWLSPVTLRRIRLTDDEGVELATIAELTTSRSLASLLFAAGDDLGTVVLREPSVTVRVRTDGSNLEEMVRPLFESEGSGAGMTLVIDKGTIAWSTVRGEPCSGGLENINGTVRQAADSSLPALVELQATLSDGERHGTLSMTFKDEARAQTAIAPEAVIKATALPLAPLQPWFDRFRFGMTADGLVSTDLLATAPKPGETTWAVDGWVEGTSLRLARHASDRPFLLEGMTLKAKGTVDRDHLALEKATLRSEVGTADLAGRWTFASLAVADGWLSQFQTLIEQDTHLTASIDLSRLAKQLPAEWRTNQAVESGHVELSLQSMGESGRRAGAIELVVSEIAIGGSRGVVWQSPLRAEARVRCAGTEITVDRLKATSEFLTVTGSGAASGAELSFNSDLDILRERLASLFPISKESLSGRIDGRIGIQQTGEGRSHVDVIAAARDLSVTFGETRWREKELSLALQAELGTGDGAVQDILSGRAELRSAENDEVAVTLTEPVSLDGSPIWNTNAHAKGDLSRWLSRARVASLVSTGDWEVGGSLDASAKLQYERDRVAVSNVVAEVGSLRLRLGSRFIDEPRVRLTGDATWLGERRRLTVPNARLLSETATIDVTKLTWPTAGDEPAAGQLAFRAGIGRVARYVVSERPAFWLSGVAAGTIDLQVESSATVLNATVDLERPTLTQPALDANGRAVWQPVWSDERASIQMAGRYTHPTDALALSTCRFTSSGLDVEAAGRMERLTSVAIADIAGTVTCDLEPLSARFAAGLPEGVMARGSTAKPFTLRGPLFSAAGLDPQLSARAGFGWEQAKLWGLAVGAGEVAAGLKNRTLAIEPFEWPVGSGRVRGSAAIALSDPFVMTVPQGRIADRVVLTPDVCRTWLRYAAPALADSTTVEGTASIDVAACAVPLVRPEGTEARGVLEIHSATAVPGAVAKSLVDVIRQIQSIAGKTPTDGSDLRLVAPQQKVTVAVSGGRVHHDRFTVHVGDASGPAIATAGSVGFDQSIDLVAEVTLDRAWFKNERIAAALGGQALRVPIRGTLSNPAPDPRALQEFGRKAAAGAIEGLLEREVDKQIGDPLRKLFD